MTARQRNQSPVTSHQSPDTSHQTPVTSHQSPDTSCQSPVTRHQTPVTSYQLQTIGRSQDATEIERLQLKTKQIIEADQPGQSWLFPKIAYAIYKELEYQLKKHNILKPKTSGRTECMN